MRPGGPALRGTLTVGNAADLPLDVAVSVRAGRGEASRALEVSVSPARFSLSRRGSQRLRVRAWLPASAGDGVRARAASADLRFRALTPRASR